MAGYIYEGERGREREEERKREEERWRGREGVRRERERERETLRWCTQREKLNKEAWNFLFCLQKSQRDKKYKNSLIFW